MKKLNKYENKFFYFLSVEKIKEQHDCVPESLEPFDGVPVLPNVKLNCGVVADYLVSLDWCNIVPVYAVPEEHIEKIVEKFNDEELYTPLEEVLYESFNQASYESNEYQRHAIEFSKALTFALSIIEKYKDHLSLVDRLSVEGMKLHIIEEVLDCEEDEEDEE